MKRAYWNKRLVSQGRCHPHAISEHIQQEEEEEEEGRGDGSKKSCDSEFRKSGGEREERNKVSLTISLYTYAKIYSTFNYINLIISIYIQHMESHILFKVYSKNNDDECVFTVICCIHV